MTTGMNPHNLQSFPNRIAHYRIVRKLGQGGMSIVYEGIDERLKRPVALKILHPFLAERLEYRSRFLREAEAVARLTHPNIMQIFDVAHTDSSQLYIVTELLVGETLKDWATHIKLIDTPELSAMIIWEILHALDHAHKRGIIHRDIKPENIMIGRDGQIKLMDFGIASIGSDESLTQSGTLLGSLAHLSPEVIRGEKASNASDLYSLSTVFYWLLSAQLPFSGDSPHALLKAIVDSDARRIQTLSPYVSDDLAMVVERGMSKNAATRFSSALEMAEAIEHSLHNLGIAIDSKAFHQALKNPGESIETFKDTMHGLIKNKLAWYQQQKDDAWVLALECRLGALPTAPKTAQKPRLRNASAVFFVLAAFIAIALATQWHRATALPPEPPVAAHFVEEPPPLLVAQPLEHEPVERQEDEAALPPAPPVHQDIVPQKEVGHAKPERAANAPIFRTVEIIVWPFADISLNGNLIARDTKSISLKLELGTYTLTFSHTYAATVEKIIKVTEGQSTFDVRVSLDKSKPAFLVVKSNVDCDVAVEGSYRGTAKKSQIRPIVIPMPDKSHAHKKEVIISQDNYEPYIVEMEFIAGATKVIEVKLVPNQREAKSIPTDTTPGTKKLY